MLNTTIIINNVVTTLLVRHLYNCFLTFNILSAVQVIPDTENALRYRTIKVLDKCRLVPHCS